MRSPTRGAVRYGKWNAPFAREVNCSGIRDRGSGIRLHLMTPENDPNDLNDPNDPNDLHYQPWTITNGCAQITAAWG